MLQRLGEHIADALRRAEEAERRAAAATDPAIRADYEMIARSWRTVARSFEFAESLEKFLLDSQKYRDLLPPKPPRGK
jgi:hypothetical protein